MVVSLCLNCGSLKKFGPLQHCQACLYSPEHIEDKASHFLTSTHYYSIEELQIMGQQITKKCSLLFEPQQIEESIQTMLENGLIKKQETKNKTISRIFTILFCGTFILLLFMNLDFLVAKENSSLLLPFFITAIVSGIVAICQMTSIFEQWDFSKREAENWAQKNKAFALATGILTILMGVGSLVFLVYGVLQGGSFNIKTLGLAVIGAGAFASVGLLLIMNAVK